MPIPLSCPCGRRYQAPDELAGKAIRCRQCQKVLKVPASDPDVIDDMIVDEPAPSPPRRASGFTASPPVRPKPSDDDLPVAEAAEPKRRKKRRRIRYDDDDRRGGGGFGISISPGIIGGALMMLLAVVWFIAGLYFGWIFFYPPILFIIGLVRFVLSLFGHEED